MSHALRIVPMTIKAANKFVAEWHRHHKPVVGALFAIACEDGSRTCGIAIVGRPVARMMQDGLTAEVVRLATNGTKNACSKLYSAAWRICREMGYLRLVTYILSSESGTSLRAANWRMVGNTTGGSWSRPSRNRTDKHPLESKTRYEVGSGARNDRA